MRRFVLLVALVYVTGFASAGSGAEGTLSVPEGVKNVYITSPIYSELVLHQLPTTWNPLPADQREVGPTSTRTYLPKGQSLDDWKDILIVQAAHGWSKDWMNTPESFLRGLGRSHRALCGADAIFEPLGETLVDGHTAYRAIIGCAAHPGKPGAGEINYFVAVRGTNDLYVFQRGMRVKRFSPDAPPMSADTVGTLMKDIEPIAFCDWPAEKQGECKKTRS
jgi:hypothetical protein